MMILKPQPKRHLLWRALCHWSLWVGIVLSVGCQPSVPPPPPQAPASPATTTPNSPGPVSVSNSVSASPSTGSPTEPRYYLDHAQKNLPKVRLWIGAVELEVEVCHTIPQIATGLMHRSGIGPEEGMLFLFGRPHQPAFYMRNVDFDISAAYIDPEGVIQEIVQLKKRDETPVPAKSRNIQFVLEAAPDWFSRHGITPGTLIKTSQGTLKATFGI